jgi:hypothetical protein
VANQTEHATKKILVGFCATEINYASYSTHFWFIGLLGLVGLLALTKLKGAMEYFTNKFIELLVFNLQLNKLEQSEQLKEH